MSTLFLHNYTPKYVTYYYYVLYNRKFFFIIFIMAKRKDILLTDSAKPIADKLSKRASLKLVLSAGIICLNEQSPESRERFLDLASGTLPGNIPGRIQSEKLFTAIEKIVSLSCKNTTQIYKILSDGERKALDELHRQLGPEPSKRAKKA